MPTKPSRRAQPGSATSSSGGTADAPLPPSLFAKGPFPLRAALLASAAVPDALPPGPPGGAAQPAGVESPSQCRQSAIAPPSSDGRDDSFHGAEGAIGAEGARRGGETESAGSEGSGGVGDARRGLTCWTCGEAFADVPQQRAHCKADWHRLNVKRRASGRPALAEDAFTALVERRGAQGAGGGQGRGEQGRGRGRQGKADAVGGTAGRGEGGAVEGEGEGRGGDDEDDWSSISGSEDEEEGGEGDEQGGEEGRAAGRSPKVHFVLPETGDTFALWRVLFSPGEGADLLQELVALGGGAGGERGGAFRACGEGSVEGGEADEGRSKGEGGAGGERGDSSSGRTGGGAPQMQAGAGAGLEGAGSGHGLERVWVVVLSSGGHFSAAVLDAAAEGAVLAHRSFHRSVRGARQGGRAAGHEGRHGQGAAVSGGQPEALQRVGACQGHPCVAAAVAAVPASSAIHIRACAISQPRRPLRHGSRGPRLPGSGRAPVLLSARDPRVRRVPFPVRRPTFKEALRVARTLAHVQVVGVRRAGGEGHHATTAAGAVGGEEGAEGREAQQERSIVEGRAESSGGEGGNGEVEARGEGSGGEIEEEGGSGGGRGSGKTELHVAAAAGNHAEVTRLLQEGCDPTARDGRGRVPYVVAANRATRDAFRRFMAGREAQWDWHAAQVPSALTEELQASQAAARGRAEKDAKKKAKEKERRQRKKQEERERKQQALLQSAHAAPSPSPASPADQLHAMTELRAREREVRAAAAERRLQQLCLSSAPGATVEAAAPSATHAGGSGCDGCGVSLAGKTPFFRLTYKYCSTACVRAHKTVLDSL
ncbi:hypothetical protein CLOM_g2795 [Closterium sp. NIES-68]|nr:hypothetical protein CLOM_g2795 [Closterium sp. NIES-68]